MRTDLSDGQIEQYREDGFLVVEGFLDGDELEVWRKAVGEAVEERLETSVEFLTNQRKPDDFYAKIFTQCLRLADTHVGVRELIYDPRIAEMGGRLAGVDGLRVWHDQALIKPPYGNPTAWHLDNPYWSFSSRDAISCWLALDDATLGNGCMWYISGSHKTARFDNAGIGTNLGGLFAIYPEWLDVDPVPAPCSAGSLVWHNGLVAHGAGANMSRRDRRAMTCAFMPDGATFNGTKNILPEEYYASLTEGDLLDDEKQNPLLWHK
jgi:ectoine hydroxylase-related dioxygenase (phytanoyl-CoA dioxygenase family)